MTTHRARLLFPNDNISIDFYIARATALDVYARVEQSLLRLYAHITGLPVDIAGITFFKINNARSTITIIESLLKKKYGSTYNIYWNTLKNHLKRLSDERNLIVHRSVGIYLNGQEVTKVALISPNWEDRSSRSKAKELVEIEDFIVKAYFMFRSIQQFHIYLAGSDLEIYQIFVEPFVYPPKDDHPLYAIDTLEL